MRERLLDAEYWRPRLERLQQAPRSLLVLPRPELGRPGIDVVELRLRAHDGARLTCILGRPAFCSQGDVIYLRTVNSPESTDLDWHAIERGHSDVVFGFPEDRALEDRVLDVIRLAQSVASVEATDWHDLNLSPPRETPSDELVLADLLRETGWV